MAVLCLHSQGSSTFVVSHHFHPINMAISGLFFHHYFVITVREVLVRVTVQCLFRATDIALVQSLEAPVVWTRLQVWVGTNRLIDCLTFTINGLEPMLK